MFSITKFSADIRKMKKTILFICMMFSCLCVFAELYKERATVSFYADSFHGKKTSSGETFNMYDLTCANKTLPFGTLLKVTNLANGKSVTVRVNDRGPFVADRELDLSKGAAQKLDMINSGTAQTRIELIKKGPDTELSRVTAQKAMQIVAQKSGSKNPPPKTASAKQAKPSHPSAKKYPAGTTWDLQVGAFSTKENANELAQKLMKSGFKNVVFQKTNTVYRVVIKDVPSEEVESTRVQLVKSGFSEPLVRQRKA